jgi:hypothetical protein
MQLFDNVFNPWACVTSPTNFDRSNAASTENDGAPTGSNKVLGEIAKGRNEGNR